MKYYFFTIFLIFTPAWGKDLGKHSNSYGIKENSGLEQIKSKEGAAKLDKFQDKLIQITKEKIAKPNKVPGISNVTKNSRRLHITEVVPDVLKDEDILIPKNIESIKTKEDIENIQFEIFYSKGTKVNPLDYEDWDAMVFVDGNDEKQLEFARSYQDHHPEATIMLIHGKPGEVEVNGKDYMYYYDQLGGPYCQMFGIVNVPSVVWQDNEEQQDNTWEDAEDYIAKSIAKRNGKKSKVLTIDEVKID